MPHLTLITPTYNSARTLSDTIESVLEQVKQYPNLADNLEYIIIDGASSDETVKIVQGYQKTSKLKIKLISEPDRGIYDAMNKGINLSLTTADDVTDKDSIIGIINSDDFYRSPTTLKKVIKAFASDPSIDAVYGDLIYVQSNDTTKQTRYWKAGEYKEENLNWGWSIPHPTFFVRRRVYQKLIEQNENIFNTNLSLAADVELIFRLLKIHKIKVKYTPEVLVTMRNNGKSANSLKQRIKGWKEQRMVWKLNNLAVPHFFITRRLLHKIWQYIRLHK
jgi:glycosyltransferase